jgi:hypothetical protein
MCLIAPGNYAVMPLNLGAYTTLFSPLISDQEGNISVFWGNPKLDSVGKSL